jgi:hypothetical protein
MTQVISDAQHNLLKAAAIVQSRATWYETDWTKRHDDGDQRVVIPYEVFTALMTAIEAVEFEKETLELRALPNLTADEDDDPHSKPGLRVQGEYVWRDYPTATAWTIDEDGSLFLQDDRDAAPDDADGTRHGGVAHYAKGSWSRVESIL